MKFARSEYTVEELILVLGLCAFFTVILVGSFQYAPGARLFPMILSIPALVLIVAYIFRGLMPPAIVRAIEQSDQFAIGGASKQLAPPDPSGKGDPEKVAGSPWRPYFIFAYTFWVILFAYLIGFYAASLMSLLLYLYVVRKETASRKKDGLLLIVAILAIIYVFDLAFGYHFSEGVLVSLPAFN